MGSHIEKTLIPDSRLTNALGDSLKVVWENPKKYACFVRRFGENNWEVFAPKIDSMQDERLFLCDPRCTDARPWGFASDIYEQFLLPKRKTPPQWLEEAIACDGKKVPESLWKRFFPNPYGGNIPVIHIIRVNLEDDPENEVVLWYNRPPGNKETCQSMVEFFDFKAGEWYLENSLGPFFTTIQVKIARQKKAVSVEYSNTTSDGRRTWNFLYSMKGGLFHVVE